MLSKFVGAFSSASLRTAMRCPLNGMLGLKNLVRESAQVCGFPFFIKNINYKQIDVLHGCSPGKLGYPIYK